MSAAAEGMRLFELLTGQKEAFEKIARGEPLADVLDSIIGTVEGLVMDGARASIRLTDEDGHRLRRGAAGLDAVIDAIARGDGVGSFGTGGVARELVVAEDLATDPSWADFRDLADAAGLRSCWSMPIVGADDRLLGTFSVLGPEPGGPDASEVAALQAFAQTAAVAIERDRSLSAMAREKRTAEALQRVGRGIAARLDLHEVVQVATDEATELIGAAFGAFFYNVLGDDGASMLLYTLSGVPRSAFERFPNPRSTAIFAPTFNGEGTVRIADVTLDPRFGHNHPHHGMPEGHLPVRSYLAVSVMLADGEVAGGLFFGHPDPGVFDADDERLAEGIAAQAAIAIQNARLYEAAQREIVKRKAAFEERDRVARTLQQSLLPPELPTIPGMSVAARYHATSEDIGGDFYDVFSVPGGGWGLVVGDVCGKGVEAAKLTALARHTVHTAAMLDARPAAVLDVLNTALLEQDRDQRFCTAIVALLQPRADGGAELVVALGGHPPGLLLRDGEVTQVGEPGRLLGVYGDPRVREVTVSLQPGDVVVLHTDGLTDVVRDGTMLGDGWVHDTLRGAAGGDAEAIAEALGAGAEARQHGLAQRDDIALLALSVG